MGNILTTSLSDVYNALPTGSEVVRGDSPYVNYATAAVVAYFTYKWGKRYARRSYLQKQILRRQAEREESIRDAEHAASLVSKELREKISAWDFDALRENLQNETVSCVDVVRTYIWKALRAHEKTNCVCLFVKEAEQWARDWDEHAKDPSFEKPAFFGIPISVKECVTMAGYDVSRGFAQDLFKPKDRDCVIIEQCKTLGMIPYVQTNVPQSLLAYNSCNPVYGATCSPLDPTRTTGGSSGGESAILAADGSILGIGSDVGGSIRIPSHFAGTAGIKPSHLRFSHRNMTGAIPGRPLINSNEGPMTKDIKTTVTFLKEVWKDTFQTSLDPYVPPVRWQQEMYEEGRKFKIGWYIDDGWFTPVPAVQRAVLEAKAHLEAAGHILVPFKPPRVPEVMRLYIGAICLDGGRFILDKLRNDIMEPTLAVQMSAYQIPIWLQRLLSVPVSLFHPRLANIMGVMSNDTGELREIYAAIEAYRTEYTELMVQNNIDALLCPPQVMTTPPHIAPCKVVAALSYTGIYNLLDYGAGVVKATEITKEDDDKLKTKYPQTDAWYRLVKDYCKDCVGFPVGVQVAAPPYREEIVLRILRDIEVAVTGK